MEPNPHQSDQTAAALARQTAELKAQRLAALNIAADAEEARRTADEARRRAERNEQALATANAELQRTQQALADMAAQLALPVRDLAPAQLRFRISEFSLTDMMSCGAAIRGMRQGCPSAAAFAAELIRFLYEHMIDESGRRACALVRLYETRRFDELDPERRAFAARLWEGASTATRCLTLAATVGDCPEWNDCKRSLGHQAIPLASPEAVERLPMIAQLIRQLGFDVAGVVNPNAGILLERHQTGVFHVAEARGSAFIPAQEDFVVRYGIRSVLGFGDVLPDGRLFAVILFAKAFIPREVGALFGHLSLSTRMALLSYLESPERTRAQIASLDRLLQNHEELVAAQERMLQTTLQELRRSNSELEQFAYIASHDMQEPLRKIRSFGDMLAARVGPALDEEARLYLERMQNAAQRMQGLISDLLTFARVTTKAQPFQKVNLGETAHQVVSDLEILMRSTGGSVEVGDLPTLEADPTQMRQLLQNLIGNALKFHRPHEPPQVKVQSRLLHADAVHALDLHSDDALHPEKAAASWWQIDVGDNGIGFEEKHLERIFLPFQRLHGRGEYEGTGMGLAICRKIAQRHEGSITASSTPGKGSTFIVRLPARRSGGNQHE